MSWFKKLFGGRRKLRIPKANQLFEAVRTTPFFRDVPEDRLRKMIEHSKPVMVKDADVILREGEEGNSYYLILEGMASVVRPKGAAEKPTVVSVLAPGFAFGEEALISNAKRNATIIMETDGILLKIPKNAFIDHIVSSLVTSVSPIEAQTMIHNGAKWLDVRDPDEYQRSHLPHAISMPLPEIREQVSGLDSETTYICYCGNGRLGATAAFLMRLAGYKAANLQGGLKLLDRRLGRR